MQQCTALQSVLLEISPLQHQLKVHVGTDVESFNPILAVVSEAKDLEIQVADQSEDTHKNERSL